MPASLTKAAVVAEQLALKVSGPDRDTDADYLAAFILDLARHLGALDTEGLAF